ncbi:sigma-70 family RNA polymerase sigma factor [Curtobacterium sp. MCPF17_002]|uniref:sigma-70 family RNA polymerase sigma factor n=1 Tax=Curtobacterium sp. MCPF17_002 TaxID=2175645 RepID=UPI0015E8965F|nr:sigma-70 family RNA polymerase sigma factor [Curtobacterium sp. MCPF17_002]WIB76982.1 sigma-70 family RNA polymerase sigma factor [Curtobacterium sp. MCPF17_002]
MADRDLLRAVRAGDRDAYGELWSRHAEAIRKAASFFTGFDPDDVTAETFARVLRSIEHGHGPVDTFRPYAMVAARNIATEWSRARSDLPLDVAGDVEDETLAEFASAHADDRSLAARAFHSLPDRWQEVLWYTEVEQMKPAEVAPLLGMSANSVAALSVRAREGLKQAWIAAHVRSENVPDEHKWAIERAAKYARNKLPAVQRRKIDEHLEDCPNCRLAFEEIDNAASRIALVLLPLVLGSAATAYASYATTRGATMPSAPLAGGRMTTKRARLTAGAVATVAAVALTGVAVHAAVNRGPDILESQAAVAAEPHAAPDEPRLRAAPPITEPAPDQTGTATTGQAPAADHPSTVILPTSTTRTGSAAIGPRADTGDATSTEPGAVNSPPSVPTPGSTPSDPTGPTTTPTAPPTAPTDPPTTPSDPPTAPSAPVVSTSQEHSGLLPVLSGTAEPGATIVVNATEAAGTVAGPFVTTVDDAGAWQLVPELPEAGEWTLTITQTIGDLTSTATDATSVLYTDDLVVDPPTVQDGEYLYWVKGTPGADVEVLYSDGTSKMIAVLSDGQTFWSGPTSPSDSVPAVTGMRYSTAPSHGVLHDLSSYLTG